MCGGPGHALAKQSESDDDGWTRCTGLFSRLLSDDWSHSVEAAIDITLIGRYYERYADHAVSVARQTIYLVTGEPAPMSSAISGGATETALGV